MGDKDYTTIALLPEDKERLDEAGERLFEGSFSYRDIVTVLLDEFESQQDGYEEVLARAIAGADEGDVERVISKVNGDREFVKEVSCDDE